MILLALFVIVSIFSITTFAEQKPVTTTTLTGFDERIDWKDVTNDCIAGDCRWDASIKALDYNNSLAYRISNVFHSDILQIDVHNSPDNPAPLSLMLLNDYDYNRYITNREKFDYNDDPLPKGTHYPVEAYPNQQASDLDFSYKTFFVTGYNSLNIVFFNDNAHYDGVCNYGIIVYYTGFGCLIELGVISIFLFILTMCYVFSLRLRHCLDRTCLRWVWCCWYDYHNSKYSESAHRSFRMRRQEFWAWSIEYWKATKRQEYSKLAEYATHEIEEGEVIDTFSRPLDEYQQSIEFNTNNSSSLVNLSGENNPSNTPQNVVTKPLITLKNTFDLNETSSFIGTPHLSAATSPNPLSRFSISSISNMTSTSNNPFISSITNQQSNGFDFSLGNPLEANLITPQNTVITPTHTPHPNLPQFQKQPIYTPYHTNNVTTLLEVNAPLIPLPNYLNNFVLNTIIHPSISFYENNIGGKSETDPQLFSTFLHLVRNGGDIAHLNDVVDNDDDLTLFTPRHIRHCLNPGLLNPNPFIIRHQSQQYIHRLTTTMLPLSFIDPVFYNNVHISSYSPIISNSLARYKPHILSQQQFIIASMYGDARPALAEEFYHKIKKNLSKRKSRNQALFLNNVDAETNAQWGIGQFYGEDGFIMLTESNSNSLPYESYDLVSTNSPNKSRESKLNFPVSPSNLFPTSPHEKQNGDQTAQDNDTRILVSHTNIAHPGFSARSDEDDIFDLKEGTHDIDGLTGDDNHNINNNTTLEIPRGQSIPHPPQSPSTSRIPLAPSQNVIPGSITTTVANKMKGMISFIKQDSKKKPTNSTLRISKDRTRSGFIKRYIEENSDLFEEEDEDDENFQIYHKTNPNQHNQNTLGININLFLKNENHFVTSRDYMVADKDYKNDFEYYNDITYESPSELLGRLGQKVKNVTGDVVHKLQHLGDKDEKTNKDNDNDNHDDDAAQVSVAIHPSLFTSANAQTSDHSHTHNPYQLYNYRDMFHISTNSPANPSLTSPGLHIHPLLPNNSLYRQRSSSMASIATLFSGIGGVDLSTSTQDTPQIITTNVNSLHPVSSSSFALLPPSTSTLSIKFDESGDSKRAALLEHSAAKDNSTENTSNILGEKLQDPFMVNDSSANDSGMIPTPEEDENDENIQIRQAKQQALQQALILKDVNKSYQQYKMKRDRSYALGLECSNLDKSSSTVHGNFPLTFGASSENGVKRTSSSNVSPSLSLSTQKLSDSYYCPPQPPEKISENPSAELNENQEPLAPLETQQSDFHFVTEDDQNDQEMHQLLEYGLILGNATLKNRINTNITSYISRTFPPRNIDLLAETTDPENHTCQQDQTIDPIIDMNGDDINKYATNDSEQSSRNDSTMGSFPRTQQVHASIEKPRQFLYTGDLSYVYQNILQNDREYTQYLQSTHSTPSSYLYEQHNNHEFPAKYYNYSYTTLPTKLEFMFNVPAPQLKGYHNKYIETPWCLMCCVYKPYQRTRPPRINMTHPFDWEMYDEMNNYIHYYDKYHNKMDFSNPKARNYPKDKLNIAEIKKENDRVTEAILNMESLIDNQLTNSPIPPIPATPGGHDYIEMEATYSFELIRESSNPLVKSESRSNHVSTQMLKSNKASLTSNNNKEQTNYNTLDTTTSSLSHTPNNGRNSSDDITSKTDEDAFDIDDYVFFNPLSEENKYQYAVHQHYIHRRGCCFYNSKHYIHNKDLLHSSNFFVRLMYLIFNITFYTAFLDAKWGIEKFNQFESMYKKDTVYGDIEQQNNGQGSPFVYEDGEKDFFRKSKDTNQDIDEYYGKPLCFSLYGISICSFASSSSIQLYENIYSTWRLKFLQYVHNNYYGKNQIIQQAHVVNLLEKELAKTSKTDQKNVLEKQFVNHFSQSQVFEKDKQEPEIIEEMSQEIPIAPQKPAPVKFHVTIDSNIDIYIHDDQKTTLLLGHGEDDKYYKVTRSINVRQLNNGMYTILPPPHILDIYSLKNIEGDANHYSYGYMMHSTNNYYTPRDDSTLPSYIRLADLKNAQLLYSMQQADNQAKRCRNTTNTNDLKMGKIVDTEYINQHTLFTDNDIVKFDPDLYHINIITDYQQYFSRFVCTSYFDDIFNSTLVTFQYNSSSNDVSFHTTTDQNYNQTDVKNHITTITPNGDPYFFQYQALYEKRLYIYISSSITQLYRHNYAIVQPFFPKINQSPAGISFLSLLLLISKPCHTMILTHHTQDQPLQALSDLQEESPPPDLSLNNFFIPQQDSALKEQISHQLQNNAPNIPILPHITLYDQSKFLVPPAMHHPSNLSSLLYNCLPVSIYSRIPQFSHKALFCDYFLGRPRVDWAHYWKSRHIYLWSWTCPWDDEIVSFKHRILLLMTVIMFNLSIFISFSEYIGKIVETVISILTHTPIVGEMSAITQFFPFIITANLLQTLFVAISRPFLAFTMFDCYHMQRSYNSITRIVGWVLYCACLLIMLGFLVFSVIAFAFVLYSHRCQVIFGEIIKYYFSYHLISLFCVVGIPSPLYYALMNAYGAVPVYCDNDHNQLDEDSVEGKKSLLESSVDEKITCSSNSDSSVPTQSENRKANKHNLSFEQLVEFDRVRSVLNRQYANQEYKDRHQAITRPIHSSRRHLVVQDMERAYRMQKRYAKRRFEENLESNSTIPLQHNIPVPTTTDLLAIKRLYIQSGVAIGADDEDSIALKACQFR